MGVLVIDRGLSYCYYRFNSNRNTNEFTGQPENSLSIRAFSGFLVYPQQGGTGIHGEKMQ